MNKNDLGRLSRIETRINNIAKEYSLLTTEIDFEIVPARRMLEAMSYWFPVNFSHWVFGRDFDKNRTIYEYTGQGIPYEQVWNFEKPRALLVKENPFVLNVLTIAHVYGHVDFFLGSAYLQRGRAFSDIAEEARNSTERFHRYGSRYGHIAVEEVIDASMSIQWQEPADPFLDEPDDEEARKYLIEKIRKRLSDATSLYGNQKNIDTKKDIISLEEKLKQLEYRTPPEPVYDLLKYLIAHAPYLNKWERDVLGVVRNQARALSPNRRTKILNEGWATFWHARIMRRLFQEGLLTPSEHGVFVDYHAKVTQASKIRLNEYHVGSALFENIQRRWDMGCFGSEYNACVDPIARANWDTKVGKGTEKIFSVRASYTDRMAIEDLFSDEFIHEQELYLYGIHIDKKTNEEIVYIVEKCPGIIRSVLKEQRVLYGIEPIAVVDGNYRGKGFLFLRHDYHGVQLNELYTRGTLEHIYRLWKRPVYLETRAQNKKIVYVFDGKQHKTI